MNNILFSNLIINDSQTDNFLVLMNIFKWLEKIDQNKQKEQNQSLPINQNSKNQYFTNLNLRDNSGFMINYTIKRKLLSTQL